MRKSAERITELEAQLAQLAPLDALSRAERITELEAQLAQLPQLDSLSRKDILDLRLRRWRLAAVLVASVLAVVRFQLYDMSYKAQATSESASSCRLTPNKVRVSRVVGVKNNGTRDIRIDWICHEILKIEGTEELQMTGKSAYTLLTFQEYRQGTTGVPETRCERFADAVNPGEVHDTAVNWVVETTSDRNYFLLRSIFLTDKYINHQVGAPTPATVAAQVKKDFGNDNVDSLNFRDQVWSTSRLLHPVRGALDDCDIVASKPRGEKPRNTILD